MNIDNRIKRLEVCLDAVDLPKDLQCQCINIPFGLDTAQSKTLIRLEEERILARLHEAHGLFNEDSIKWVIFVDPFVR
jgi:hypothetical protein